MRKVQYTLAALVLTVAACSPPATEQPPSPVATPAVPPDIAAVVSAAVPGITVTSAELDASDNEYEVAGTMPNGEEIELDLVQVQGAWSVAEIQRDVAWSSVPAAVRNAATAAPNAFEPVRVIESKQPSDGSVVFELFSAEDKAGAPSMEVRWLDQKAAVVQPEP